jgi:HPt (histidine-containing phosphotransfer) domain-containing protein
VEEQLPSTDPTTLAKLGDPSLGGNPDFLSELVVLFGEEASKHTTLLRRAAPMGTGKALFASAHALKGSCAYFGAARLVSLCQQLEVASGAVGQGGAMDLVEQIGQEVARVEAELEIAEKRFLDARTLKA